MIILSTAHLVLCVLFFALCVVLAVGNDSILALIVACYG